VSVVGCGMIGGDPRSGEGKDLSIRQHRGMDRTEEAVIDPFTNALGTAGLRNCFLRGSCGRLMPVGFSEDVRAGPTDSRDTTCGRETRYITTRQILHGIIPVTQSLVAGRVAYGSDTTSPPAIVDNPRNTVISIESPRKRTAPSANTN